jgi:hypothetical protein
VKAQYLILAIYIFVSALYPCRDSDFAAEEVKDAIAVLMDHDHSHSGMELDICSPFCICSCCSAHIKLVQTAEIDADEPYHNTILISRYIERPVLGISSSIWQPPRI